MEMRKLGDTGIEVSRLGIGLVEIGRMLTLADKPQASNILNTALDLGVNFLDTAACYGISEEMIGQTIHQRRNEFILATKVGHMTDGYRGRPWSAQAINYSVERSLSLMKTDYLDIVQIHAWDMPHAARPEVVGALVKARENGKIRFIGYSHENEGAEWAVASGYFDTLQTVFSIVDQRARYSLLKRAQLKGIGIIIKRPLANAMWARPYSRREYYSNDGVAKVLRDRADRLSSMGPIEGAPQDPIEMSLAFVMSHDEIDIALVGTRNLDHLRFNIQLMDNKISLPDSVLKELHRRFDEVGNNWPSID